MPLLSPFLDKSKDDKHHESDVLPPELREKFNILTSIAQAKQATHNQLCATPGTASKQENTPLGSQHETRPRAPDYALQNPSENSLVNGLPYDLALAAAIAAEEQISNLSNGIAELEALLAARENSAAAHPFMPSDQPHDEVVPVPIEEEATATDTETSLPPPGEESR